MTHVHFCALDNTNGRLFFPQKLFHSVLIHQSSYKYTCIVTQAKSNTLSYISFLVSVSYSFMLQGREVGIWGMCMSLEVYNKFSLMLLQLIIMVIIMIIQMHFIIFSSLESTFLMASPEKKCKQFLTLKVKGTQPSLPRSDMLI